MYSIVPGSNVVELAGIPPVKVQLYMSSLVFVVQFSMLAVGLIVRSPQESSIVVMFAVGGFFTSIICVEVAVPQIVVMFCVRVYSPGLLNKNSGFSEAALVPFVNSQLEVEPQFSAAYETDHS